MLRMDQVHVIRHKILVEGQSIRRVAREMHISRITIRRYLEISQPVRVEDQPRPAPIQTKVAPRLDQLLEEWRGRTTAKQHITGTLLHRRLVEEGYQVGITTVRAYLREKRRQSAEVFIPLVYRPGEVAQVDFFEVAVEEAQVPRKAWKFLLHLMYSGADFVWLYDRCDQLSFLDGHVRAFAFFEGVAQRLVYDNLSAAVRRLIGHERELTERFTALVSHYLFEPCFARPGEGHDKGGVESRGKAVRLQHMVPVPRGETLCAISTALLAQVQSAYALKRDAEGRSLTERLAAERRALRTLPAPAFDARRVILVAVSNKATVHVEGAVYSVPSTWAGLEATAYVGVDEVRIICRSEQECYAKERPGVRRIRYKHYLRELARKPQAVRQVAPDLTQELGQPYGQLWSLLVETHGAREAARLLAKILGAIVEHGEESVSTALSKALVTGQVDLLALGERLHATPSMARVEVPEPLRSYQIEAGQAADYDWLLEGGAP